MRVADFGFWPEGEVLTCVSNVGSQGNCGRDVLALSLTVVTQRRHGSNDSHS
jgi:hypothetical protein